MIRQWLTKKQIEKFRLYLQQEEKSCATVEKYVRDVAKFGSYLAGNRISRERVLAYKHHLIEHYQAVSVNSMLAALNCFLRWQGLERFRVRPLKIQRQR